jgi:UDP-N-acetylglucosamine 2-epimerase (non-hydrolysing)
MKIAPVVDELRNFPEIQHCLVHSGQHYDELLSENFFPELGLPTPDVNLQVGSGSHAVQTAEIMKRLEPVLLDFRPHMVLVVGDVNSTIATALTAVKLGIRVAHIEAGLRSFDMAMPEEINRKLTDAISDLLFVTEQSGLDNLHNEGIAEHKIFLVGNVMIDTLHRYRKVATASSFLSTLGLHRNGECQPYGVLTLHRPSNVDDKATLEGILTAVGTIASDFPVFFPVHPRTRKNIDNFGLGGCLANGSKHEEHGIVPLDPLGYIDFVAMNDQARLVLTDSGGIQEESTVLGVPCLTLRENTERPSTIQYSSNQLVGTDPNRIIETARSVLSGPRRTTTVPPLWDGKAAQRIVRIIHEQLVATGPQ